MYISPNVHTEALQDDENSKGIEIIVMGIIMRVRLILVFVPMTTSA